MQFCAEPQNFNELTTFSYVTETHHRILCLDRLDLQAVFHSSRGTVGIHLAVQASQTVFGICLILPIAFRGLQSRRNITSLFLGDVGFWSVDCLNMLPERTGVRVTLGTAWDFTHVRFLPRRI